MNPITFIYAIIRNILWNEDNGTHNELEKLDKFFGYPPQAYFAAQSAPCGAVFASVRRKKAEPWLCFFSLILRTRRLLSRAGRGL